MLIAILLIYICYYFRFPIPIIIISWCNLWWEVIKVFLMFFQVTDKDNNNDIN